MSKSIEDKLDKVLEDVAVIRTVSSQHTTELLELQQKLEPVFEHVIAVKTIAKLTGAAIGLIACIAGVLALLK